MSRKVLNEEAYNIYLVTGSLADGVNAIVARGYRPIFNDRYNLWPDLKEQPWLDRFMKAVREFPYHFTLGTPSDTKGKGGSDAYEPRFLGYDASAKLNVPPESSFSYKSKEDIDAGVADPGGVISASKDDWMIPKTQASRFIDYTLEYNLVSMKGLDKESLDKLAPLRPFALFAVILGYQYPNFMLHYFAQSVIAAAGNYGSYSIDSLKAALGVERSSRSKTQLNRNLLNKFVNQTNTVIESVFPDKASRSVLGDDKDKLMREWIETTKLAKLFTISLAPHAK